MTTTYPGRKRHFDLGGGHSFEWYYASATLDQLVGIIEYHYTPGKPGLTCACIVAFVEGFGVPRTHMQLGGGPGDEAALALAPVLSCPRCETSGYIREGTWIPA